MDVPDVLGFTLDDALKRLDKFNISPLIIETSDLRTQKTEEGILRVVKQSKEGDQLKIITCKIPDLFR